MAAGKQRSPSKGSRREPPRKPPGSIGTPGGYCQTTAPAHAYPLSGAGRPSHPGGGAGVARKYCSGCIR